MINAVLLAALLQKCAPQTDVRTLAAIVNVESGGDSWAIRDPIANRAVHPSSYVEAVTTANRLLAQHVAVSVGLSQVLLPRPGMNAATLLGSPCANLRAGAKILSDAYAHELRRVSAPGTEAGSQMALRRALSVYNSGTATGAPEYTQRILAALTAPLVEQITALADAGSHGVTVGSPLQVTVTSATPSTVSSVFFAERKR